MSDYNVTPLPLKPKKSFHFVSCADVKLDTERLDYLIEDFLPAKGLCVFWGERKSYKSFVVMDLVFHIAAGLEYRGMAVDQRPVFYLALEGREGLPARVEALMQHYGTRDAWFYLCDEPLNLRMEYRLLIDGIAKDRLVGPGVVVIDTLNRSLVGSEGKDEDMAAYIAAADEISNHFKCLVVIIHHCGVDTTRPRGHTALSAAVDVQFDRSVLSKSEELRIVERCPANGHFLHPKV